MTASVTAPVTAPSELPNAFLRAFNARDLEAIDRLFEPGAVRVLTPGEVVTGDGRRAATASFLALGIPMKLTVRHCYEYGDLALLLCDYLIKGAKPDGTSVHHEGTATDVVRRGADGVWRYAIDNPPGIDRVTAKP
ncbi:YybH family protein [Streptomyces sp. NPDC058646]|uniref:YybH family protein n=1 Tax=Streptomyces sp. NPDC058646 TaxID=3346574 RepID=UPI003665D375